MDIYVLFFGEYEDDHAVAAFVTLDAAKDSLPGVTRDDWYEWDEGRWALKSEANRRVSEWADPRDSSPRIEHLTLYDGPAPVAEYGRTEEQRAALIEKRQRERREYEEANAEFRASR